MECIILAGGQGTRLQSVVGDLPKCMAPINDKPFLEYLLNYLEFQGVDHVILSLGYQYEQVLDWLKGKAFLCKVSWVIEREPLGTGGGMRQALQKAKSKEVFVLNGDTYFPIDLRKLQASRGTFPFAMAVKPMQDFDRYGTVLLNDQNLVTHFVEKKKTTQGLINGGIYLLDRTQVNLADFPKNFSIENDLLPQYLFQIKAEKFDDFFIDIGIPEDYERAQSELSNI